MKLNIQLFADGTQTIIGSLSGSSKNIIQFYAIRSYTQNIDELKTIETINLYLKRLNSSAIAYNTNIPYQIKENDKIIFSGNCTYDLRKIGINGSVLLASRERTIQHNQNGVYEDYTLSARVDSSGNSVGIASLSQVVSTPTIPTSYPCSISNFDLGQNPTINVGVKENSNYTYNLSYFINEDINGTIANNLNTSTYIWEMEEDLINQIKIAFPTQKSIPLTITCETFDGEISKGTKESNATITIIDYAIANNMILEEKNEIIKNYTNSEYIIKDLSKIEATIDYTPPLGTTIKTYEVTVGGTSIIQNNNDKVLIENITEYSIIDDIKKTTFWSDVIDNRGTRSGESVNVEIPFIDYIKSEYINTECYVKRSTSNIDKFDIELKGNVFNDNIGQTQNILTLGYKYKIKDSADEYTIGNDEIVVNIREDNTFIVNQTLDDFFDHTENYEILFTIKDLIYIGNEMTKYVSSSQYIMFRHKTGVDFLNATILGKQVATTKERILVYENEEGLALSTTIGTAQPFTGINLSEKDYSNYKLNIHIGFTASDGTKNNGIQIFSFDLANYETITGLNVHFMSGYTGGSTNDFFMIVANISNLNTTSWQWKPTSVKWFQSNNSISVDTNLLKRMKLFKVELEEK